MRSTNDRSCRPIEKHEFQVARLDGLARTYSMHVAMSWMEADRAILAATGRDQRQITVDARVETTYPDATHTYSEWTRLDPTPLQHDR